MTPKATGWGEFHLAGGQARGDSSSARRTGAGHGSGRKVDTHLGSVLAKY